MFHVGQKVVCVDALDAPPLVRGQVYEVLGVGGQLGNGPGFIQVDARANPWKGGNSWLARRFRPVKTTCIDVFTAMLALEPNAPAKKREKVA